MPLHILGLGPITAALSRSLQIENEVQIYSTQGSSKFDVQVSPYEKLLAMPVATSDIFLLAWKDLEDDDLLRHAVLDHLSGKLTSQNTVFNLSSVAVYGDSNHFNHEFVNPHPISTYGTKKLALENLYDSLFASKLCHLRISNVFGDSRFNDVINRFITSIINGKAIEIWGTPNTSRDYISLQTVVNKISTCLQNSVKLETREVLNICSGHSMTLQEVVEMIQDLLNRHISFEIKDNVEPIIQFSAIASDKFNAMFGQVQTNESKLLRAYLSASLTSPPKT
jgi:hypothetical protein